MLTGVLLLSKTVCPLRDALPRDGGCRSGMSDLPGLKGVTCSCRAWRWPTKPTRTARGDRRQGYAPTLPVFFGTYLGSGQGKGMEMRLRFCHPGIISFRARIVRRL